jgi:6-phosphogluconolactonase (cycloisomerase 2 family)
VVQNANFDSLDTSPDGQWLIALDSLSDTVRVYGINTSTGVLTATTAVTIGGINGAPTMTPKALRISPNGDYVAVALGAGGLVTFAFNTSTAVLTESGTGIYNSTTAYIYNAVAFDSTSSYLWVAQQGGTTGTSVIGTYSIGSAAVLTGPSATIASGDAPYGLLVESTGSYLYSANRSSGNVSGYSIASGVLTAQATSPYLSGITATALAEDNTHKYVIAAAAGGSSDLTLYGVGVLSAGVLSPIATAVSGTDPAGTLAVATTH